MKILKILLWIVVSVSALFIILTLVSSKNIRVERSRVINAPVELIFEQVNDFHQWVFWSPWHQKDTAMLVTYSGNPAGPGSSFSWNSQNEDLGNGSLTILASSPFDSIRMDMKFMEEGSSISSFVFQKVDSGVLVLWSLESELPFFMRIFGGMMDQMVGADFEQGLENLETRCQKLVEEGKALEVVETTFPGWKILGTRVSCTVESIGPSMGAAYGQILEAMGRMGLKQSGPPFAVYSKWDNNAFEFLAGIPVNRPGISQEGIVAETLSAGPVAMVRYFGPYEGTGVGHETIRNWAAKNGRQLIGNPWEVYVTDPGTEKDPRKYLTEIYYYLKEK